MNAATVGTRFSAPSNTTIGHLTVRHNGPPGTMNPTALRLRVERLLGGVNLHPAGLASGAVLIVRSLRSPLQVPTLARSSQSALEEYLRNQLAVLYSSAARPASGGVSSSAHSVLFTDPAEMLTCLTYDLLNGQAWQRWYWQQLLMSMPRTPASALTAMWSGHAAFVPIVLAALRFAEARAAIALLSPAEVSQITYALHSSFDLPSTALAVLSMTEGVQPNQPSPDLSVATEPATSAVGAQFIAPSSMAHEQLGTSPFVPPWQRWLPNEIFMPPLTPPAHYLLGLGLTLYYAPALARSARFAAQAATWMRTQRKKQPPELLRGQSPQVQETAQASVGRQKEFLSPYESQHPQDPDSALSMPSPAERDAVGARFSAPTPIADPALSRATSTEQPFQLEPLHGHMLDSPHSVPTSVGAQFIAPSSTPGAAGEEFMFGNAKPFPSDGVLTELGGILYLVNLLNWLNLLGAWDEESGLCEHLSGWGVVEILARGLLGAMHDRFVNDPIWSVLALLDQREPGTPVGTDMAQQAAFRLPAQWLRRYGPAQPEWSMAIDDFRLLLIDAAASYLVADVPLLERSPGEVMIEEVEAYRVQGVTASVSKVTGIDLPWADLAGLDSAISIAPKWWLERVSGFIHHLLARALGEPSMPTEQLAEALLCKQARLLAGRTHIDLHMSLEQISLPIRKAGLDRDPAWVPDLGRIILFHFD